MKASGVVRRVDDLGRVVIPREIRLHLGIREGDALEILVDGDKIVLTKYGERCVLCGNIDDLIPINNTHVCADCKDKLNNTLY